jgi:hypothetical protein
VPSAESILGPAGESNRSSRKSVESRKNLLFYWLFEYSVCLAAHVATQAGGKLSKARKSKVYLFTLLCVWNMPCCNVAARNMWLHGSCRTAL